jgi:hypothetical protein
MKNWIRKTILIWENEKNKEFLENEATDENLKTQRGPKAFNEEKNSLEANHWDFKNKINQEDWQETTAKRGNRVKHSQSEHFKNISNQKRWQEDSLDPSSCQGETFRISVQRDDDPDSVSGESFEKISGEVTPPSKENTFSFGDSSYFSPNEIPEVITSERDERKTLANPHGYSASSLAVLQSLLNDTVSFCKKNT